jgi:PAS domain S-box-containing protein
MEAEESLLEQSEHNRLIIETAGDAFIGMEPDGLITAWNRQAELLFGWSAAEIMGRRLSDTIVARPYRDALADGVEHFVTNAQGSAANKTKRGQSQPRPDMRTYGLGPRPES